MQRTYGLRDRAEGGATMDAEKTLGSMTRAEKIALCEGGSYWHTRRLPRLGVPAVMLCDGPNAVE